MAQKKKPSVKWSAEEEHTEKRIKDQPDYLKDLKLLELYAGEPFFMVPKRNQAPPRNENFNPKKDPGRVFGIGGRNEK